MALRLWLALRVRSVKAYARVGRGLVGKVRLWWLALRSRFILLQYLTGRAIAWPLGVWECYESLVVWSLGRLRLKIRSGRTFYAERAYPLGVDRRAWFGPIWTYFVGVFLPKLFIFLSVLWLTGVLAPDYRDALIAVISDRENVGDFDYFYRSIVLALVKNDELSTSAVRANFVIAAALWLWHRLRCRYGVVLLRPFGTYSRAGMVVVAAVIAALVGNNVWTLSVIEDAEWCEHTQSEFYFEDETYKCRDDIKKFGSGYKHVDPGGEHSRFLNEMRWGETPPSWRTDGHTLSGYG